ncbi:MAG: type II secretion system protein [Phycisphaerae bacterium]
MKRNCHNSGLPPSPADGRQRRGSRCARPWAFTLVELLTIIVILSMLITLTAPSVMEGIRIFRVNESRSYFRQIAMGIGLYKEDWKDLTPVSGWPTGFPDYLKGLPPSSGSKNDSVRGDLKGAYALVQALTGYRPDDGKVGWGSKYIDPTVAPGRGYGPYVSGELPMGGDAQTPAFLDAFANKILYYRLEPGGGPAGGKFERGHNDDGPMDLDRYLQDPNQDLYRRDYVLITSGPDRQWMKVGTDTKTDDIANFLFRFDKEAQRDQE